MRASICRIRGELNLIAERTISVRDQCASSTRRCIGLGADTNETHWRVLNPRGQHAIAAGLDVPITVEIEGHVGYYCAGMNKRATVIVHGNAGAGRRREHDVRAACT